MFVLLLVIKCLMSNFSEFTMLHLHVVFMFSNIRGVCSFMVMLENSNTRGVCSFMVMLENC